MPSTPYLLAAIAVSAAITWTLRAAPFAVLTPLRNSAVLAHLAVDLPVGMMTILAAYTVVHQAPPALDSRTVAAAVALAATIAVHRWRHNAILSVVTGTVINVAIASLAPVVLS
ncbi:AzlD domain-containing protein [Williamsia sp. MIQD14]|uniref:AzlD domain-containing protein n=1 Tax=Williamsia sp. MIQD14 TaxID=3425703 RepID=UPI003DA0641C